VENDALRGDLSETPFPELLGLIWRESRTGRLSVRRGPEERLFAFVDGSWSVGPATFDGPGFLAELAARGRARPSDLAPFSAAPSNGAAALLRGLIGSGTLPAPRAWELVEGFSKERLFEVFGWTGGTYDLGPAPVPPDETWIDGIDLAGLILEGVRRMGDAAAIEAGLPGAGEKLRLLPPRDGAPAPLLSHERYVLAAAGSGGAVGDILRTSVLGERETARALYALLVLGLLGAEKGNKPPAEYSLGDMDRLFEAFNDRCAYIHKYISKEIGPVALSVVEKAVEDVRERIDPAFQTAAVKADGRIELRTLLRKNLGVSSDEGKRSLLRSFDEILAAEVLAVKRTLGNGHEAALVRGLERLGDLS
jgi:hypothetical protein